MNVTGQESMLLTLGVTLAAVFVLCGLWYLCEYALWVEEREQRKRDKQQFHSP
jgi:predicted outer membrane lipoprotein